MSQQKTGRVTIQLEDETLRSKPGAGLQIGGVEREWDATDQGESYFSEKSTVAMITATLIHVSDTNLQKLQRWKNGTAQYITDTGIVYTISGAGTAKVGDLKNGEVEITIGGDAVPS